MLRVRVPALLLILALVLVSSACQRKPKSTAELPYLLSPRYSVAVMPFTQPVSTAELITGTLPQNQGIIQASQLAELDDQLQKLLLARKGQRDLTFGHKAPTSHGSPTHYHAASQPQALAAWAEAARKTGKDFILVPQVLDWHDREGSKAGVTSSASIHLVFYLIRSSTGTIQDRAIYEESQVGLTENLLTVGDFIKRRGAWISGVELAAEGMPRMLRDLGLN